MFLALEDRHTFYIFYFGFSVCLNGSLVGFFQGKRGIWQGDPLSPYLFVMAMNVLSHMLDVAALNGVFQFHPKWVSQGQMQGFQRATGFSIGALPVRYLGIPSVTRKLSVKDCTFIIEKIKAKLNLWASRRLSYAGRLQLVKAVLFSIVNYWCRQVLLPTTVIKKVEHLCCRFLWRGSDAPAHGARVSWAQICLPKKEGGLGVKDLKTWNIACFLKLMQNLLIGRESLWIAWIREHVICGADFWQLECKPHFSWRMKRLLKLRAVAHPILSAGVVLTVRSIWEGFPLRIV